MPSSRSSVHEYHDGTKHHFHRFARSLGYLDWASQPHPFRTFEGSIARSLYPASGAPDVGYSPTPILYDQLFVADSHSSQSAVVRRADVPVPGMLAGAVGDLLRHSLGLSAWKRHGASRWALRVNPSSGNLHPTEAYVVCGPAPGLAPSAALYHYAADRHVLEERCRFDASAWAEVGGEGVLLIALTSIHWRESWKYGERAFRYCQHDLGHAIAAVRLAATLVGLRAELLPLWSHDAVAALIGIDRQADFLEAEPEEPGCLLAISSVPVPARLRTPHETLLAAVRRGTWSGRATQLSEDHVEWSFLEDVARATRHPGFHAPARSASTNLTLPRAVKLVPRAADARALVLQRRSALRFDGRTSIGREAFMTMVARTCPGAAGSAGSPWDALWWSPFVHLVLFVHRVEQMSPGLYLLMRSTSDEDAAASEAALRAAMRAEFLWEPVDPRLRLWCLTRGDCRGLARRLSCDQDIAADGYFSVAMLAAFDAAIGMYGPSFYRQLFWETGVIGQVLYLEAEAARARATGIGCFYDDPVHEMLGLSGHTFQSLYHFTVGTPVDDPRLTSEPGYEWEGVR